MEYAHHVDTHIAPSPPRHPSQYDRIYDAVHSSGLPNFLGARIPLQHNLHIAAWRRYLSIYNDPELPEYLEYGFPLGYTLGHTPVSSPMNHSSALCYPSHVNHYIATESHAHALCGPFPYPPFEPSFQINPLMTAPKKHSEMRRVILDLSHPEGASVNYGIPRDTYLGVPYKLHLPSAQDLRGLIVSQGQGCHLWSVDLQRGYRQLRVCPMDWPLLGIAWNGAFYFDMAVPFGIRWGAMYMQRTTSAVTRLAGHESIPCIAYIDDVASAQSPGDAIRGKRRFQSLLRELGLQENVSKGSEPSTRMTWLGVDFDSEAMTMSVPTIKINECLRMARSWATKEYCTKSQLRKFLGKLFHICQCCPTLRLFVNRLLETLRSSREHGRHPIGPAFKADIHWISQYLPLYNGIQMIPRNPTLDTPISVDSCLTGGGGHFGNRIYYTAYPEFILQQALNISELEMLNALIAIKLWAPMLSNHVVRLQCDNSAAVSVLQSGRGRASFLLSCAREVWAYTAQYKFEIRVEHIPGSQNILADQLSRYHSDASCRARVDEFVAATNPTLHHVDAYLFKLSRRFQDF